MKPTIIVVSVTLTFVCMLGIPAALADDREFSESLTGYEEPPPISTVGGGEFSGEINEAQTQITWELSYFNFDSTVQQAHIHFGQKGVNGGITVFLCTNLGNGPAGTQRCPPAPATITGTITAADVSPPIPATQQARGQGLDTGEFAELIRAMRARRTYVNVHSTKFPGGEIRSQINLNRGQDHDGHKHGDHK